MNADNVANKIRFVRSFSCQHRINNIANITFVFVFQICTEKYQTRLFICKVNLILLSFSDLFNCDSAFAVIVFFSDESVHGFKNIRIGKLKTRFQMAEFWQFRKFLVKEHELPSVPPSLRNSLVNWWVCFFSNCKYPIDPSDSYAPVKRL